MKKLISILILSFCVVLTTFAQSPNSFNYQLIVRNNGNNSVIANQTVGIRITIRQGSQVGNLVYRETHSTTTNSYGLVNLAIGEGSILSGAIANIPWNNGPFVLQTAVDPTGGTNYTIFGNSDLHSVPYALFAANAGSGSDSWTVSGNDQYANTSGNVGIGTATPNEKLEVNGAVRLRAQSTGSGSLLTNGTSYLHAAGTQNFGSGGNNAFLHSTGPSLSESSGIFGNGDVITLFSPGDGVGGQPSALLYFLDEDNFNGSDDNPYNGNAVRGYITPSGTLMSPSDRNRKQHIEPLTNSLERLLKIKGYSYEFKLAPAEIEKGDKPIHSYGVIAQEVAKVFPEIVEISADGSHYVSYTEFIPFLIESIKEQQEQIEQAAATNAELKAQLKALADRLSKLENN